MLARRLTTILPAMTLAEAIETTRIHRVAGRTGDRTAWVTTRPCRAPYQTISDTGLIGGGHVPMPGDVSLAHDDVLFLDELPEFRRHVLEVLRQPPEMRGPLRPSSAWRRALGARCTGASPPATPHAPRWRKPCQDLLYISGDFRRLYPVGTDAKSMSCWTENTRRAERLGDWG